MGIAEDVLRSLIAAGVEYEPTRGQRRLDSVALPKGGVSDWWIDDWRGSRGALDLQKQDIHRRG
jgi:hypothetical protein